MKIDLIVENYLYNDQEEFNNFKEWKKNATDRGMIIQQVDDNEYIAGYPAIKFDKNKNRLPSDNKIKELKGNFNTEENEGSLEIATK